MQFVVYPNPSSGAFHIESRVPRQGNGVYRIITLSGAVIIRGILDADGHAEIETTSMPPGLYIVQIEEGVYREHHKLMVSGQ